MPLWTVSISQSDGCLQMSNPGFVTVPTLVPKRFRKANARANAAIR